MYLCMHACVRAYVCMWIDTQTSNYKGHYPWKDKKVK